MTGLRTNTAVFLLLLLGPALLLAWLGFAATVPLEQELRRNAKAATLRAATAFAVALPPQLDERLADEARRLAAVATGLAAALPTRGPAALLAAEDACGAPLVVRGANGAILLPAPPRDLAMPWLDEWPAYRAFAALPAAAAAKPQAAAAFVAPSLRARALATLPDVSPARLAATAATLSDAELVAAGPLVVERLLADAAGRQRLLANPAALVAVPAPEARRRAWYEQLGFAAAAARQRVRLAHERRPGPVVRAALPGGSELQALLDPAAVCRSLATTHDACSVHCTPREDAPPAATDDTDTVLEVPSALGPLTVHADHADLPNLLQAAARRRWLTGAGVLSLVAVMGLGVLLVRRAFRQEAAARALRDQFLANVSHDLKTPLTSLRLHAEMLTDPALAPDVRARYAAVVQAEGARMSALVEDLVDVSALQQGRRRIEPEPVDLAAAVRGHAAAWQPLLDRDQIGLRVVVAPPSEALVDPIALGRIVTNLLQNAVRHGRPARDGGPSWIELRAGPGPVLEVRDNGPGVPAERRERIFTRFERATARGDGLGLGLALSRELATACGGTLGCRDDGATAFRLALPAVPAEQPT